MNLVIVESPTKAKTLSKYLGSDYVVEASMGHVRDLPQSKIGIDIEKNFEPVYQLTDKGKDRVLALSKLSKKADRVYLATDPDREGEAISWHISQELGVDKEKIFRITFHEISKKAIEEALGHEGQIDMQLVDAQQARRVLDRLVGYKLSPVLWKKVRRGLSAGRVQSVALRLIVEREREIEAFVVEEYWEIFANLFPEGKKDDKFLAKLVEVNGKKIEIPNKSNSDSLVNDLNAASFLVGAVNRKNFSKTAPPAFTTSTLQMAAANRLGFTAKKTMQVAQSLYEEGLITYHRTDSLNLSSESVRHAFEFISSKFGREYAVEGGRFYKTKAKVAQEAHEAIRPVDLNANTANLNKDQSRLYEMIEKRFLACQMKECIGENVTVVVTAKGKEREYKLEAKGEVVSFDGWTRLYTAKASDSDEEVEGETKRLPNLTAGEILELIKIDALQKFTKPPARYNDASIIKALEELGIGRPSTYAPTLSTIQERQYVERIEKRYKPTAIGIAVNDFLVKEFVDIVDYQFTANMEDSLDEIANGQKQWRPVIAEFYKPFIEKVLLVEKEGERVKIDIEKTGDKCPTCSEGDVVIRHGRFGKFLSCSRYPECKYTAKLINKIEMKCPKCSDGDVVVKRTKKGKTFYGCSKYPECDFASWNKPVAEKGIEK